MNRQSTPQRSIFSASTVLDALADDLMTIKSEDGLTYADIGRVLGKSDDQAEKYCKSMAEMGVVAFAAGKREWNGRFTGKLDALCVSSRPGGAPMHDRKAKSAVLEAALALSQALEDDDGISPEEVRDARAVLERAKAAIDAQLSKLVRLAQ
jgi:succinyl-CoA synthetase alpha subunit